MAKRKRLEAPSTDDLSRIEAEYRSETRDRGALAPIAQVAADSARAGHVQTSEAREAQARDRSDAEALRAARDKGLVMLDLPLAEIDADDMMRDRIALDDEEMAELRHSISEHGLRLPIEVYALPAQKGDQRYGLISGYRRLLAVRALLAMTGEARFATIRAVLTAPATMGEAFVAMVEENEIRSGLSHFERGRVAVLAAQTDGFADTEDAIERLFASASKAKRSKVRGFALIFEELGDLIAFPKALNERRGLRIAQALRSSGAGALRDVLAAAERTDAEAEWEALEDVLKQIEAGPTDPRRGGRPKAEKPAPVVVRIDDAVNVWADEDEQGPMIRLPKGTSPLIVQAFIMDLKRIVENG